MGLKRLGTMCLGLIFAIILVTAIPLSTAQNTDIIPKDPAKLTEAMLPTLETVNEKIHLQENLDEIVEKAEEQLMVDENIEEAANAIEGAIAISEEFLEEETIAEEIVEVETETEETEIEETVEVETETEGTTSEETGSEEEQAVWQGEVLNAYIGVVQGPSGKETYYNLHMGGVINLMKSLGYDYEYWVREDGVKMYGDYIMCAAHLGIRPKGTILETSLGTAMVCDTGSFAESNPYQIDIAVDW